MARHAGLVCHSNLAGRGVRTGVPQYNGRRAAQQLKRSISPSSPLDTAPPLRRVSLPYVESTPPVCGAPCVRHLSPQRKGTEFHGLVRFFLRRPACTSTRIHPLQPSLLCPDRIRSWKGMNFISAANFVAFVTLVISQQKLTWTCTDFAHTLRSAFPLYIYPFFRRGVGVEDELGCPRVGQKFKMLVNHRNFQ